MAKISVSIIGLNEAANLGACLESVKWADETVFVDCGSADDSLEIAKRAGAKVFSRENTPNLNINKQFGLEQCSGDWILYLDPDELAPPELAAEIIKTISEPQVLEAYSMPRKNFYFGKWLSHGGKYPDKQLRLFKRGVARFPCRDVHERLEVDGKIGRLSNPLLHCPCGTVDELFVKMDFYSRRKAERFERENKGVALLWASPVKKFLVNYFFKFGFLDGMPGFSAAVTDLMNEIAAILRYTEKCARSPSD